MRYTITTSKNFLRDLKTCKKRGYDIAKLWNVIGKLQNGEPLLPSCRPHKLSGNHQGKWLEQHKEELQEMWDKQIITKLPPL